VTSNTSTYGEPDQRVLWSFFAVTDVAVLYMQFCWSFPSRSSVLPSVSSSSLSASAALAGLLCCRVLPRDAMLARYMASSCVCLSVCVSVTLRYCIKTAKHRIRQIMPHDIPWTRVFWHQVHGKIRSGSPPNGPINADGGLKWPLLTKNAL